MSLPFTISTAFLLIPCLFSLSLYVLPLSHWLCLCKCLCLPLPLYLSPAFFSRQSL